MEADWEREQRELAEFWDRCFTRTGQEETVCAEELAPSRKSFEAARSLGTCRRVLDYGCGEGWGALAAALGGCPAVTAVDLSAHAVETAARRAQALGVSDRVTAFPVDTDWLSRQPDGSFDGFFCSNVLDVVPEPVCRNILEQAARLLCGGGRAVIGMNYWLTPERAAQRGMDLREDGRLYVDGILRMVSRTDAAWEEIFSPLFTVEQTDHFAWPGEEKETRRIFLLRKKDPSPE